MQCTDKGWIPTVVLFLQGLVVSVTHHELPLTPDVRQRLGQEVAVRIGVYFELIFYDICNGLFQLAHIGIEDICCYLVGTSR